MQSLGVLLAVVTVATGERLHPGHHQSSYPYNHGSVHHQSGYPYNHGSVHHQSGYPYNHGSVHGTGHHNNYPHKSDGYFYSWRDLHPTNLYTWDQAYFECYIRGYKLVSLDTAQKDHYIANKLAYYHIDYIWTSGTNGFDGHFRWGTGDKVNDRYYTNWSKTGQDGYPQPDNREYPENCLAMLNNIYKDGITWHDINCNRKKHFVCEIIH